MLGSLLPVLVLLVPTPQRESVELSGTRSRPDREEGSLQGVLLDEHGAPCGGWALYAHDGPAGRVLRNGRFRHGESWRPSAFTSASGRFRFQPVTERGLVVVSVSPDETIVAVHEAFSLEGEDIVLRLDSADRPTSWLKGLVVDRSGRLLDGKVWTLSLDGLESRGTTVEGGRFTLGPLRPGEHELVVDTEGYPRRHAAVDLSPGEVRWVDEILVESGGRIAGQVTSGHLPARLPLRIPVTCGGSLRSSIFIGPDGEGVSNDLAPGRYVVGLRGLAHRVPEVEVVVTPGETTTVELAIEPAVYKSVLLPLPHADPSTRMHALVIAPNGETVMDRWIDYRGKKGFVACAEGLVSLGPYRLEAWTPTGLRAAGVLVVRELVSDSLALELPLR